MLRSPEHLAKHGENYPDPCCYLTHQAKYLFRNARLRHIRIEQFNRYLHVRSDERSNNTVQEIDDVLEGDLRVIDKNHRNYDHYLENVPPGTIFPSVFVGGASAKRRHDARLGASRLPCLEPIGDQREKFYELQLFAGLAWYSDTKPLAGESVDGQRSMRWTLKWQPPKPDEINGAKLEPINLDIESSTKKTHVSFEALCTEFETTFADPELDLLCRCCHSQSDCDSCRFAVGFHMCRSPVNTNRQFLQWRAGSLHNGKLDIQRVLWNLHKRGVPSHVLEEKAREYVESGYIDEPFADSALKLIAAERGIRALANDGAADPDSDDRAGVLTRKLSPAELETLLQKREQQMRTSERASGDTDQWRVYKFITESLAGGGKPLRLIVQASAGTGKSFLLSTVYLWCIVRPLAGY